MSEIESYRELIANSWAMARGSRDSKEQELWFPKYRGRELDFIRHELNTRLWHAQRYFIDSVFTHKQVAWRSGRKNGKTRAIAALVLAFLFTRPSAIS